MVQSSSETQVCKWIKLVSMETINNFAVSVSFGEHLSEPEHRCAVMDISFDTQS
jgi:hypothetical protein